jgi:hypothetical protein
MNYYKKMGDHQYDGRLLQIAEEGVAGSGDGRISRQDAEKLLTAVKDGNIFTPVEKETVKYLHQYFKWTEAAWEWFNQQIEAWQGEFERPDRMSLEELSKQHFPTYDVLTSEAERTAREHVLKAATDETYQDHDEIALILRLANGKRVEIVSNFIELTGNFVELRGGFDIPVRAIEKVEI